MSSSKTLNVFWVCFYSVGMSLKWRHVVSTQPSESCHTVVQRCFQLWASWGRRCDPRPAVRITSRPSGEGLNQHSPSVLSGLSLDVSCSLLGSRFLFWWEMMVVGGSEPTGVTYWAVNHDITSTSHIHSLPADTFIFSFYISCLLNRSDVERSWSLLTVLHYKWFILLSSSLTDVTSACQVVYFQDDETNSSSDLTGSRLRKSQYIDSSPLSSLRIWAPFDWNYFLLKK